MLMNLLKCISRKIKEKTHFKTFTTIRITDEWQKKPEKSKTSKTVTLNVKISNKADLSIIQKENYLLKKEYDK